MPVCLPSEHMQWTLRRRGCEGTKLIVFVRAGYSCLARRRRVVYGFHLQDHLRRPSPRPPRVPAPPDPDLQALHRGLQDAHGAYEPGVLGAASEEGRGYREEEAVQAGEAADGGGEG